MPEVVEAVPQPIETRRGLGNDDLDAVQKVGPGFLGGVFAGPTVEPVLPGTTNKDVSAFAAIQLVFALAAKQPVITALTVQLVSTTVPVELVVAMGMTGRIRRGSPSARMFSSPARGR